MHSRRLDNAIQELEDAIIRRNELQTSFAHEMVSYGEEINYMYGRLYRLRECQILIRAMDMRASGGHRREEDYDIDV